MHSNPQRGAIIRGSKFGPMLDDWNQLWLDAKLVLRQVSNGPPVVRTSMSLEPNSSALRLSTSPPIDLHAPSYLSASELLGFCYSTLIDLPNATDGLVSNYLSLTVERPRIPASISRNLEVPKPGVFSS